MVRPYSEDCLLDHPRSAKAVAKAEELLFKATCGWAAGMCVCVTLAAILICVLQTIVQGTQGLAQHFRALLASHRLIRGIFRPDSPTLKSGVWGGLDRTTHL